MQTEWILWRRLDTPGHDACRLVQRRSGWRLEGSAVFQHATGAPACLAYRIDCDTAWRTHSAAVRGWVGARRLDLRISRTAEDRWLLGGEAVADWRGCACLDLGFTPATNLAQLRRAALQVGEAVDVPVAWLDVPDGTAEVLAQRYERRSAGQYWYEAPRFGYAALLEVSPAGFVVKYPGLWEAEPAAAEPHD